MEKDKIQQRLSRGLILSIYPCLFFAIISFLCSFVSSILFFMAIINESQPPIFGKTLIEILFYSSWGLIIFFFLTIFVFYFWLYFSHKNLKYFSKNKLKFSAQMAVGWFIFPFLITLIKYSNFFEILIGPFIILLWIPLLIFFLFKCYEVLEETVVRSVEESEVNKGTKYLNYFWFPLIIFYFTDRFSYLLMGVFKNKLEGIFWLTSLNSLSKLAFIIAGFSLIKLIKTVLTGQKEGTLTNC